MGRSDDGKNRETYDPFKKPENNGTDPRGGTGTGYSYPGGNNGGNAGFGYPGGSNGGNGSGTQNSGGFYGPDYFTGRSGYGYAQGPAGGYGYAQGAPGYGYQPVRRSPGYGFSVASAILGTLSIVFCLSVWVPLITGVLAIVFALIARKRDGRFTSTSRTGLILGIIALVLVALVLTYVFTHFDEVMQELRDVLREYGYGTPDSGNGGSSTPDTSGDGGRQLTLLPYFRL